MKEYLFSPLGYVLCVMLWGYVWKRLISSLQGLERELEEKTFSETGDRLALEGELKSSRAFVEVLQVTCILMIPGFLLMDYNDPHVGFIRVPSPTISAQLAKERTLLEEEKRKREAEAARTLADVRARVKQEAERRVSVIKEAQVRDEIARLRAERNKLREEAIPREIAAQIAEVNKQLEELKATVPQPSELKSPTARPGEMSTASPGTPQAPGTPLGDQTRLVLSGLWLGACFFLQKLFEKMFKGKGYALLTVCAIGFLLAFFTANYFLLGGSVTGGLMGLLGERS
jgi:hypothetical protein